MIKRFFIYGILGWSIEVVWTGIGSFIGGDLRLISFTNLWMFLIYGSAVFLEPIHHIISRWKWPLRGLIWVILIWGIEYSSGAVIVRVLGVQPWVYEGRMAIDSLVRLDYAPAWFVAGLIFEKIHKTLDQYLDPHFKSDIK